MIRWFTLLIFCIILTTSITAQKTDDPCKVCWHAQPKDSCDIIILTDFGIYRIFHPTYLAGFRIVADNGILINVSERDAVGASLFSSLDDGFMLGPEVRYRRWLGEGHSIEFALGLSVKMGGDMSPTLTPHVFIKWNPIHFLGIALRAQYRKYEPSQFYMSAGIELGWWPSAILTGTSAVIVGIYFLLYALIEF